VPRASGKLKVRSITRTMHLPDPDGRNSTSQDLQFTAKWRSTLCSYSWYIGYNITEISFLFAAPVQKPTQREWPVQSRLYYALIKQDDSHLSLLLWHAFLFSCLKSLTNITITSSYPAHYHTSGLFTIILAYIRFVTRKSY
jgi:hypothetical protein